MPLLPVKDAVVIIKRQLVYICIILFITALLLSFMLARTFIRPILGITRAAGKMASGDLSVRLKTKSKDEIGRLSMAINHLGEELAKIEQLRRDFIANVSHELRTPLSLIRGYAETIRDVTGRNEEKREKQLAIIIDETERLTKIVNDILDLSQMQSGIIRLNQEEFNLGRTISDVVGRYEIFCEKTSIGINVDNNECVTVRGDEARIQQVLYNLLNNAFNHSQPGSFISVGVSVGNGVVRVEVTDTGEGIPEEDIQHIWDRYYKADKSAGNKRIGTGLGLAIVKNILDAHNSKYGVESVMGEGTTFWFEILCHSI